MHGQGEIHQSGVSSLFQRGTNLFGVAMFYDMRACTYSDPFGERSKQLGYRLEKTGVVKSAGVDCVRFQLTYEKGSKFIADVLTKPKICLIRYTVEVKPGLIFGFESSEIGYFEGLPYPKKGWVRDQVTANQVVSEMQFSVTDVHRIDTQKNWIPVWPAGTVYGNGDSVNIIPFPAGLRERYLQKAMFAPAKYSIFNGWGFITIFAVGCLVFGYMVKQKFYQ